MEAAAFVVARGIAGVEPEIAPRLHRALRHPVVAGEEAAGHFRADQQLADLACGQGHVGLGIGHARLVPLIGDITGAARLDGFGEPAPERQAAFRHPEALEDAQSETLLELRAPGADRHRQGHAQAVGAVTRRGGRVEQELRHDAQQVGVRGPAGDHLVQPAVGAEAAHDMDVRAHRQRRERLRAERVDVEERHGNVIAVVRRQARRLRRRGGHEEEVPVRQQHALRGPCGAGCVHDGRDIPGPGACFENGTAAVCGQERLEGRNRAPGEEVRQGRRRFVSDHRQPRRSRRLDAVESLQQAGFRHDHRRLGVPDLVRQERALELCIDRHDEGAGLYHAEEGNQDFRPVAEQGHHALAGADAAGRERGGEAVRLPVEAGEGQLRPALEGREHPPPMLPRPGADQMDHRPVRPDAPVAQNRFPTHGGQH